MGITRIRLIKILANTIVFVVLWGGFPSFNGVLDSYKEFAGGTATAQQSEISIDIDKNALLVESIINIIQNYYVDFDRVTNDLIMHVTLTALGDLPEFNYVQQRDTINVNIGDEAYTLLVDSPLSYKNLVIGFLKIIDGVEKYLRKQSLNTLDPSKKMQSSADYVLNTLLTHLDAHSSILNEEEYLELRQGTEGAFGGLGVLVSMKNEVLTVLKPLPNSPAIRSGILDNDKILSINSHSTFGVELEDLLVHMRGEPGTKVSLNLLRENALAPEKVELYREIIQVESVEKKIVDTKDDILVLAIDSFSSKTSREVRAALDLYLNQQKNPKGLIIDLRSNPGGLLDQAVKVADIFLDKGVIVSTSGRREEIETAYPNEDILKLPVIILVNEDSASASEIVAGALQDHSRALVVGRPSFGKGSVQTIFELPDDKALKLTIARYYTPYGRSIQNEGIIPDIWLQPVIKKPENVNLMGPYRYNNESFLNNTLHAIAKKNSNQGHMTTPVYKGFYFTELEELTAFKKRNDYEMELALLILNDLAQGSQDRTAHKNSDEDFAFRASQALAFTSEKVIEYINNLSVPVTTWMKNTHGADWTNQQNSFPENINLIFTTENLKKETFLPGEELVVKFSVSNISDIPFTRGTIFSIARDVGFETQEMAIGKIPPKKNYTGQFKFHIPSFWGPGTYKMKIGLAMEGVITNYIKTLTFKVKEKKYSNISNVVSLENEIGGALANVIEQNESADVVIEIRNASDVAIEDLSLDFFNLSGKQIRLSKKSTEIGEIAPGQKKKVSVSIVAGETLLNSELQIGFRARSTSFREDTFFSEKFKVKPSKTWSQEDYIFAH